MTKPVSYFVSGINDSPALTGALLGGTNTEDQLEELSDVTEDPLHDSLKALDACTELQCLDLMVAIASAAAAEYRQLNQG